MNLKNLTGQSRSSYLSFSFLILLLYSSITFGQVNKNSYIVQPGDRLVTVAQRYQPTGVTLNEAMDAIYSLNQDGFINADPKKLIVGHMLRIPSQLLKKENLANTAQSEDDDYVLASGDKVNIQVFENPDLTLNTQISQAGMINFPLIGDVKVGGLSAAKASQSIANALRKGNFIKEAYVSITITEALGSAITVLGYVNKPGVYPLTKVKMSIGEVLGMVGGIIVGSQNPNNTQSLVSGSNTVIISGIRKGMPIKEEINLESGVPPQNSFVISGDILYVPPAPTFYIYGQVNQPGMRRVEPGMTVVQALASSGGLTLRGTQRNIKVYRKNTEGTVMKSKIELTDLIQAGDAVFVEESLF